MYDRKVKIKFALKCKQVDPNGITPTLPKKAHAADAGFDLVATSMTFNEDDLYIEYATNLAVSIPEGYVGLLCARSSITKYNLMLKNGIGILDSGFHGEITYRFQKTNKHGYAFGKYYAVGDRIGQLVIVPIIDMEPCMVDSLSSSERGSGGYGSSGK